MQYSKAKGSVAYTSRHLCVQHPPMHQYVGGQHKVHSVVQFNSDNRHKLVCKAGTSVDRLRIKTLISNYSKQAINQHHSSVVCPLHTFKVTS